MKTILSKFDGYKLLIFAISFIYIVFGILKVMLQSPIRDLVEAALPFMNNDLFFQLFGISEIILGAGLLIGSVRKYFAIGILLHLLGTMSTVILAPNVLFTDQLIPTLHGEFVAKNLIILAALLLIIQTEFKKSSLVNVNL